MKTTQLGNKNSIECYEACNNVVTAMNNALNRDAKKIAKAHNGFKDLIIKRQMPWKEIIIVNTLA